MLLIVLTNSQLVGLVVLIVFLAQRDGSRDKSWIGVKRSPDRTEHTNYWIVWRQQAPFSDSSDVLYM